MKLSKYLSCLLSFLFQLFFSGVSIGSGNSITFDSIMEGILNDKYLSHISSVYTDAFSYANDTKMKFEVIVSFFFLHCSALKFLICC